MQQDHYTTKAFTVEQDTARKEFIERLIKAEQEQKEQEK